MHAARRELAVLHPALRARAEAIMHADKGTQQRRQSENMRWGKESRSRDALAPSPSAA